MKRILFFTMCFAFTLTTLNAQNFDQVEFTGAGDGTSWEDDLNWARGGDPNLPGVPEPYDDILINGHYVYFNGLGSVPLNQEYGTLELVFGAHLSTQGDFHLLGDLIVDPQSTLEVIVRDVDFIYNITCEGNYYFNGSIQMGFSGFVPQIGQEFLVIDGDQGSCSTSPAVIIYGNGFEATLGTLCEFEGLSYVVTDLAYTTAYAWDGEGGDGQWNTEANWNQNTIPPPGSTVIINLPGAGGYAITNGAGITDAHTIYIGHNNTLEVNGDLLLEKFIYLQKGGTFTWKGGKIYSPDENQQSAMIGFGDINFDGPGLMELDTNFNIWQFYGDINHNGGDLDINNGIIRMFNFNSYNIKGDNITIGYSSGNLHEMTISVISKLKKTNGSGTSSINLTRFVNYGEIISESGTLAINEDLVTGEYEEYVDGDLVEYVGTYSGSGSFQFPTGYVFDGEMSPGSSPGILTVIGDLITAPEADFIIEIDGPIVGTEYDQVVVTDDAKLEGTINVTLGYLPANDASFEILTAASISTCNLPAQVTANYNGTNYTFDVVCHNNSVYLNGPGAILSTTNFEAESISMYPNPIKNEFNIKLQTPSEGSWMIFNELGQKVLHGQLEGLDTKINTQALVSGFYAIQIKDENNTTVTVKKIVK
ncbi:T9SS type A sorting domain-containing protein [Winogradskyella sp.]|uniref:T9SS type A sorting domain-containing protein n=1 Tax=Winogradskyella sp. TaxID=1883156 RepID=UPI0025E67B70|nr:T9SS type A sorting domain-containing protein [Winogradskyella sp.]